MELESNGGTQISFGTGDRDGRGSSSLQFRMMDRRSGNDSD